jgi:hypothetical protein
MDFYFLGNFEGKPEELEKTSIVRPELALPLRKYRINRSFSPGSQLEEENCVITRDLSRVLGKN